jgi:poly(beta-D-mannuronate) lyase
MKRLLLLNYLFFSVLLSNATTITVKNIDELNAANKKALPGDTVILQNGEWKNITIKLSCNGTEKNPIVFRSQTAGKVIITGNSKLKLGGNYIVVNGLFFKNGYAGDDAVISFRIDSKQLANNCRVTNTVIDDFNNPKRMDENNWVLFYGKNNQLDRCSFKNKKNMGVLLAVILDDDRSRENFHSIDHNYFGKRPPLASNGGEIIRVGVSQHCQFNSNTQIKNNFFEHCDGETEIISIKSCSNVVEENVFKESQGSVVLRHGDNNLVKGNYFVGNDKTGSGGVRVINKGQKVINNIFYKCRGVDFRSPLAVMNGIPNSPAHRYVQVTNAEIISNTFYECSPMSLCEGSDTERTLPPDNVIFSNNIFYNTRDSIIYRAYDDIKGIKFSGNKVSAKVSQVLPDGLKKTSLSRQDNFSKTTKTTEPSVGNIPFAEKELYVNSGASWFAKYDVVHNKKTIALVNCATTEDVYRQLEKKEPIVIRLTAKGYSLEKPFVISKFVKFTGDKKNIIKLSSNKMLSAFIISGNGNLTLDNLNFSGENLKATNLVSSDSSGHSAHYNFSILNCIITDLKSQTGCQNIFYAYKSMIADSVVVHSNTFTNNNCDAIILSEEKDDKGYYNAEKIFISHNKFNKQTGMLLSVYRGGNDESTLGPDLTFSHNLLTNCSSENGQPFISFTGVQVTNLFSNTFTNCNNGNTLIRYTDTVRAKHLFEKNNLVASGQLEKDQFLTEKNNNIK